MIDDRGQVSFEYLMIFAISLVILIVFTLPLAETSIKSTMDISDSLNAKSDLSKLAQCIKTVYGQGQGSKQVVTLHESTNMKVSIGKSSVSCTVKLKDKSKKTVREYYQSSLKRSSITLTKGVNTIVVEWPLGSENMVVYRV